MVNANFDQFAPNFDMTLKIIPCVFVQNLKLLGSSKTITAKEAGEFSIINGKMDWWAFFAHQHGCRNINVKRGSKL